LLSFSGLFSHWLIGLVVKTR